MKQHKKTAILWVLLLSVCAAILGSCINPIEGDFRTSAPDVTFPMPPEVTVSTTPPEQATPETTTPDATTPEQTTPPVTTPEQTTPPVTTPVVTTTPPVETTTPQPEPEPEPPEPIEKIKIYIDQGHNPFSPEGQPSWNTGASNEVLGIYEQDITFEIGILLAELLLQDDRFEVRLSRPTADTILGEYNGSVSEANDSALDARVADATAWGADYFISLHTNAFTNSTVSGLEVYVADGDTRGYDLGNEILNGLIQSTGLRSRGMKDGSELRVLKNATMPATLVEMGFISNEDDAKLLDESPALFAQGIYNGICAYFDIPNAEAASEE